MPGSTTYWGLKAEEIFIHAQRAMGVVYISSDQTTTNVCQFETLWS